jgi:MFS transporter, DHA1 family, inner membrane transport protein
MRVWGVILLLWAAGLGAAAQFGKMSVLYAELSGTYAGHGVVALGLIVSVVGMVGLVFGTTAGLLVARIGARRGLVAAMVMGGAMSALQMTWPTYPVLIASRIVEGVSHLAIVVIAPTLIAGLSVGRHQGAAMTLWSSFFGLTYAILALIGPMVIAAGGAAGLFGLHALWMAVVGAALWAVLPQDRPAPKDSRAGGLWSQHLDIYRSPWRAAPAMGFFCYTFLYVAILTLLPPEVPDSHRTLAAVGMPLISIAVSLTLGVWLLQRISAVRLVQAGYLVAAPAFVLLAAVWGQGAGMAAAGLWLSAALGIVQGASFAALAELNPAPEDRSEAAGAIAQLGNLGTTTGTPVLAALLVAGGPWGVAVASVMLCAVGVALHALQARRRSAG